MASLICLLALIRNVSSYDISAQLAAANGNTTKLKTQIAAGYVDGAQTRGTFDILWSCILTLTACIYSAIHHDVPAPHVDYWSLLLLKAASAALALLVPELVLFYALAQYLVARDVTLKVNAMRGQSRNNKSKLEPVDLQYGFYVTMGGFVYAIDDLATWKSPMTLTPPGIIALARQGHFVDINQRSIEDKNKANILTKFLICVQVSWMVIQCVARAAAGYPLTLLEIHSMVHVVCAICMYTLWWNKPFDVIEPTLISRSESHEYSGLLALMLLKHEVNEEKALVYFSFTKDPAKREDFKQISWRRAEADRKASDLTNNASQTVPSVSYLPCGMGMAALPGRDYSGHQNTWFTSDDKRRKLMELSAAAIESVLATKSPQDLANYTNELAIDFPSCLNSFGFRDGLRKSFFGSTIDGNGDLMSQVLPGVRYFGENAVVLTSFMLLGLVCGGVHLTAWNSDFPTQAESIFWRAACFVIALTAPFLLVITFLGRISQNLDFLEKVVFWACCLLSTSSRLFLLVESFISLRHVPIGVYATVPWVQNIPHV